MKLGIYSIEQTLFEGEVTKIIADTIMGQISILPNHIPLISRLIDAPIRYIDAAGKEYVTEIRSGFLEVQPESVVTVLVDG